VTALKGMFSALPRLLQEVGVSAGSLDGFLLDVGASSMQMDEGDRGFALSLDGPLDMRMDRWGRLYLFFIFLSASLTFV